MKALLVKDLLLIKKQQVSFLYMIVVAGLIVMFNKSDIREGITFIVGYITMVSVILVISTISYDDADRGGAFLFTLPFSRTTYVKEKYLLGFGLSALAALLGNVVGAVYLWVKSGVGFSLSGLLPAGAGLLTFFIMLCLMLPIQLKFGAEKGRIAAMVIFGSIILLVVLISTFLPLKDKALELLNSISQEGLTAAFCIVTLVCLLTSYHISKKIVLNKEF